MILCLLLALVLGADPAIEAGRAYEAGRFNEARTLYREVLREREKPSGALLYNLGNCDFRTGRYAEAVLYYRRAELRLPRDEALKYNLFLTRKHLGLAAPVRGSLGRLLVSAIDSFTPLELLVLMGAMQLIGLTGIVFFRRTRRIRLVLFCCLALSWAGASHLIFHEKIDRRISGIVLDATVRLREEPHADLEEIHRLKAGQEVRVRERSDHWVRVEYGDAVGWTERDGIGIVD